MNLESYLNTLHSAHNSFDYVDLKKIDASIQLHKMPFTHKILLENAVRNQIIAELQQDDFIKIANAKESDINIGFVPTRVVLQDFTGVPAVVDLAAMRDALAALGGDPNKINPQVPVDLVIDHSVMVDHFGTDKAFKKNTELEFERNKERYNFLRWGQKAFDQFRVVPPGTGIVHQVNLEYLADVVSIRQKGHLNLVCPDTLVGTDSHTTMINGLGVLGWGVGGIEAEAAMLGQPVSLNLPEVVGFKMTNELSEGTTATDLVLTVTQMLRSHGVVGKFVEFYGPGIQNLSVADRATIANMAPEYGATAGFFPVDEKTIEYLELTGRSAEHRQLVEDYCKAQTLWRDNAVEAEYKDVLTLNLQDVVPSIAGPKRPQDRVPLTDSKAAFNDLLTTTKELKMVEAPASAEADLSAEGGTPSANQDSESPYKSMSVEYNSAKFQLRDGAVVIAAITSCTNTSNPSVMLAAGLMAKNARAKGLQVKPWVKTSLAPGSQVVPAYLSAAGLQDDLDALGFQLVGFGCTTCIGNSGPLPEPIHQAIVDGDLLVTSVLSGNRNFEGRIHADVKANYLASPPLVVAYALAGTMNINLMEEPLGEDSQGSPVFLKDIWPNSQDIADLVAKVIDQKTFKERYADVFSGTDQWQNLDSSESTTYNWPESTYIHNPPFFEGMTQEVQQPQQIKNARCLVKVGDSITTDHISPAGAIHPDSPAGKYLLSQNVSPEEFNSLGSRRGNHDVMMRGTFANVRLQNQLVPGRTGGYTRYLPDDRQMAIFDAAMKYKQDNTPLIVIAGKEYGTGSSRDWAAKGTKLLGVEAVIAESFERIHRSNLVGFGVLPLQFKTGESADTFSLTGEETFTFTAPVTKGMKEIKVTASLDDKTQDITLDIRIDTQSEWDYYLNGGILHAVLRQLAA